MFTVRNLSVLNYANGFTLWLYRDGKASLQNVQGAGFFDSVSDTIADGDMMMVSTDDGAMQAFVRNRDGAVSLTPMIATPERIAA